MPKQTETIVTAIRRHDHLCRKPMPGLCCDGGSPRLRLNERQKIGVDRVRLRRGHAVWEVLIGLQRSVLQQFCRQGTGRHIGNDLIVFAMHHQHRHGDLLEVFSEIGLREGDNATPLGSKVAHQRRGAADCSEYRQAACCKERTRPEPVSRKPSLGIWMSLGSCGVAPQMRDQATYPTLGGGAGGRSLGSI
jgi:hypothetical protein